MKLLIFILALFMHHQVLAQLAERYYDTQEEAAFNAMQDSWSYHRQQLAAGQDAAEYGGFILRDERGYTYTTPISGESSSINLPDPLDNGGHFELMNVPGAEITAYYHTHPTLPGFRPGDFSQEDLDYAQMFGIDAYMRHEGGFMFYDESRTHIEPIPNFKIEDYLDKRSQMASSWGDPHLTTFDNLSYDFQAVGEYVYLKSTTSDNFEVQVRQEDLYNTCSVSFNTAIAINTGKEKVEIHANPLQLLLDGKPVSQNFTELKLKDNGKILKEENAYLIGTSEGDSLMIAIWKGHLDIYIAPSESRRGKIKGIAGNFDGNPNNDLMIDNNRIIKPDNFSERYTLFANHYKVKQETSLFTYEDGKNTASYFKQCPNKEINIKDLPNRKWAEDICRKAGVTSEPELTNCILDVALTNDASYARGAAVAANTLSANRVITTLNFPFFEELNDFITSGSASLKDNCLQITEEKGDQTAAFFTKNRAKIDEDFEVSFNFSISNPG